MLAVTSLLCHGAWNLMSGASSRQSAQSPLQNFPPASAVIWLYC